MSDSIFRFLLSEKLPHRYYCEVCEKKFILNEQYDLVESEDSVRRIEVTKGKQRSPRRSRPYDAFCATPIKNEPLEETIAVMRKVIEQAKQGPQAIFVDGPYRGTLRRGGHVQGCGCAVGEQGEEVHIQPITGT